MREGKRGTENTYHSLDTTPLTPPQQTHQTPDTDTPDDTHTDMLLLLPTTPLLADAPVTELAEKVDGTHGGHKRRDPRSQAGPTI